MGSLFIWMCKPSWIKFSTCFFTCSTHRNTSSQWVNVDNWLILLVLLILCCFDMLWKIVDPHLWVSFHADLPGFRPHALRGNRKTWCHGIAVPASMSYRGLVGSKYFSCLHPGDILQRWKWLLGAPTPWCIDPRTQAQPRDNPAARSVRRSLVTVVLYLRIRLMCKCAYL